MPYGPSRAHYPLPHPCPMGPRGPITQALGPLTASRRSTVLKTRGPLTASRRSTVTLRTGLEACPGLPSKAHRAYQVPQGGHVASLVSNACPRERAVTTPGKPGVVTRTRGNRPDPLQAASTLRVTHYSGKWEGDRPSAGHRSWNKVTVDRLEAVNGPRPVLLRTVGLAGLGRPTGLTN